MMLQNPIRRIAMLVLAGSLAIVMLPGVVLAHAELQTATPADKATVIAPVTEVSGIYTEAPTPAGSSLVVKDATGAVVARGAVDPAEPTRMVATPASPLGNGTFRVESTAVGSDGHVDHAVWTFSVAVAPSPAPTPIPATPVPSAAATAESTPIPATPKPSAAATPVPSAGGGTTGSGGDVLLPIILALIILGGGAAYLLSRRGRPPTTT